MDLEKKHSQDYQSTVKINKYNFSYSVKCSVEDKMISTSSDENLEMKQKSILKFDK